MHPIRKTLFALASLTMIFPPLGFAVILLFAVYADMKGWNSGDVGG